MTRIAVQFAKKFKRIKADLTRLEKLVSGVCKRFAQSVKGDMQYEIDIAIVDDAEIQKVNKQFLNCNCSTDCLSFDLSDDEPIANRKLFELVVNGEMAVRESKVRRHCAEAELALYITHGLLHNFGFDDAKPAEARKMHKTEDEILQQFGYGLVYNKQSKQQHKGNSGENPKRKQNNLK